MLGKVKKTSDNVNLLSWHKHKPLISFLVVHIDNWQTGEALTSTPDWHKFNPWPFKSSRCIKSSFYTTVCMSYRLNFPTTRGFMMKISLKLFYQYMAICFNFQPTSSHLHLLQVENCGYNLRLVADEMTIVNSDSKGLKRCNIIILTKRSKGCFPFEIIMNVLVSSFRFIWYGSKAIISI